MMTFGKRASLIGLLAASLVGGAAHADVVAGNSPTGSIYGAWSNESSGQNFLVRFTLAADTTLTGFDLFTAGGFAGIGTDVKVKIRLDGGGGAPSAANLYEFNDTIDAKAAFDGFSDISSVYFSGPTLAAGTYWMGVSGLNEELSWTSYDNGGPTSPAGQMQLWGDNATLVPGIRSLAYQVHGEAPTHVPEPTSWALAAVALAGLGISRRRAAR